MDELQFKGRTKKVALRVIELVEELPRSTTANLIARQLVRSATSVGANYRSACRGKSTADVLSKLAIVEEEAGERPIGWNFSLKLELCPKVGFAISSRKPMKLSR